MNKVIKLSDETKEKLSKYYENYKRNKEIPYVLWQAEKDGTVVTVYESGKIMFQGVSADVDASMWLEADGVSLAKEKDKELKSIYYNTSAVGSDEVGTGDYFGPIVVTASYVPKDLIPEVESLGIKDSKQLDDEKILKIAPKLAKLVKYKSIILRNPEYNERYNTSLNMNKIKAIMHNKVLYEMMQDKPVVDYIIVDEFAHEDRYYSYLIDQEHIQKNITFMPRAENQNLAVAASSIISRYLFLKEFDKLSDELHIPLPKGAGPNVDKVGQEIVEKYGEEKLKEIAKLNFLNTKRILKTLII